MKKLNKEFVKKELAKNSILEHSLKDAKKTGKIQINFTSCEKWNYPNNEESTNRENNYDIEGYSWEDILVYSKLKLYRPSDFFIFIKNIIKYKCLDMWSECWLWTIQSLKVIKSDMAFDMVYNEHIEDYDEDLRKRVEGEANLFKSITRGQVLKYLRKIGYCKIGYGMYVLKEDPTVIAIDESKVKFDLKDGWSRKIIIRILNKWLKCLDYNYQVSYNLEADIEL